MAKIYQNVLLVEGKDEVRCRALRARQYKSKAIGVELKQPFPPYKYYKYFRFWRSRSRPSHQV
ncbi:MAG: hypothetical protein SW833_12315 [Cyanobacteriota bacterium]|nr:hypothetical protein [Cyanobacteriota bacterium]